MKTALTRRAMIAGTAGATLIVKRGQAAEYKFSQYHNQGTNVPLHRNLVAMWDAIRAETNGRVETTIYPENNKLPAGDPAALKMLIAVAPG
jgi:TRAP-type C4-dicarboxylate transport system substrate-binding protein